MSKRFLFFLAAVLLISVAFFFILPPGPQGKMFCSSNEDCAPAQCCHPTSCVNERYAPDCEGVVCTEECRAGTMDCGQGRCECVEGECEVVMDKT